MFIMNWLTQPQAYKFLNDVNFNALVREINFVYFLQRTGLAIGADTVGTEPRICRPVHDHIRDKQTRPQCCSRPILLSLVWLSGTHCL